MPSATPTVLVFDVNETLSDLRPLASRFEQVGLSPSDLSTWFASVLRDGIAHAAAGTSARFADVARDVLLHLLPDDAATDAIAEVLSGFVELPVHADVPRGVRAMAEAGQRMVTLSNGSVEIGESLLLRAGIRDCVESVLSVDDAGMWKPAPAAYRYAAARCGTQLPDMLMVSVHPWDLHGARRAGMRTAWVNRAGRRYPESFTAPDVTVPSLIQLADWVTG